MITIGIYRCIDVRKITKEGRPDSVMYRLENEKTGEAYRFLYVPALPFSRVQCEHLGLPEPDDDLSMEVGRYFECKLKLGGEFPMIQPLKSL